MADEPPQKRLKVDFPECLSDVDLEKEASVGITAFVSPEIPGFKGVLKKRWVLLDMRKVLRKSQTPC